MMSAPSVSWISMERSGVSRWREPSRCDWKATPSSVIFRFSERLKTWKPPLSVSMGRFQEMKRCRPPSSPTSASPGRSMRW